MFMKSNHKHFLTGITLFAVTLVITILTAINISPTLAQQQVSLTVSSAIALSEPLEDIKKLYQRQQPNVKLIYNLGAYVQFLFSNQAKNLFTKYGFRMAS